LSAENELAGKVAVITGGSGAIGGAIREKLAAAGVRAISFDVAPTLPEICYLACDVRDDASVAAAVDRVLREHGCLEPRGPCCRPISRTRVSAVEFGSDRV
jgi:NAD(P)-dependent dehydrogenase (short-subunit alcohol dehydrogenase family)